MGSLEELEETLSIDPDELDPDDCIDDDFTFIVDGCVTVKGREGMVSRGRAKGVEVVGRYEPSSAGTFN